MAKKKQVKAIKTKAKRGKNFLCYRKPQKSFLGLASTFIGIIGIFMALIAILITINIYTLTTFVSPVAVLQEQVKQLKVILPTENKKYDANNVIKRELIEPERDIKHSQGE